MYTKDLTKQLSQQMHYRVELSLFHKMVTTSEDKIEVMS